MPPTVARPADPFRTRFHMLSNPFNESFHTLTTWIIGRVVREHLVLQNHKAKRLLHSSVYYAEVPPP